MKPVYSGQPHSVATGVDAIHTQASAHGIDDLLADPLTLIMTDGGDERILIDPVTGLNRYLTAPRPQALIAYSSSTANFISAPAMAEVQRRLLDLAPGFVLEPDAYARALEAMRLRLRKSWQIPPSVDIVFAASGTDLEYVGLATASRPNAEGIDNILLGIDEVGSGCIHSACALHFAHMTPLGHEVTPGQPIDAALAASIRLADVAIRSDKGQPLPSEDVLLDVAAMVTTAIAAGRQPLVHVVHGSKTGLVLPSLSHIDALRRRFGDRVSFVVDACQARISRDMVSAYLSRGCTVFLTGSKYMGGPPFSGFALVPHSVSERSGRLLAGFERIFCRAEWPAHWQGSEDLPERSNLGLLLRLEASLYELELYHKLHPAEIKRTIDVFEEEVSALTTRIGARRLTPVGLSENDGQHVLPLEIRTLATIDLSEIDPRYDYDFARRLYRSLTGHDHDQTVQDLFAVRLGQPARCIKMVDGRDGGTIRIGLSMPQMVTFAAMDTATLRRRLADDMTHIANRIDRFLELDP